MLLATPQHAIEHPCTCVESQLRWVRVQVGCRAGQLSTPFLRAGWGQSLSGSIRSSCRPARTAYGRQNVVIDADIVNQALPSLVGGRLVSGRDACRRWAIYFRYAQQGGISTIRRDRKKIEGFGPRAATSRTSV